MQKYNVEYLEPARNDIESIYTYIVDEWQDAISAGKVVSKIFAKCDRLMFFPNANPIKTSLNDRQIRFTHSGKYTIAYYVNLNQHVVEIVRVIYGKRDLAQLFD